MVLNFVVWYFDGNISRLGFHKQKVTEMEEFCLNSAAIFLSILPKLAF